jgi:hypothetical protein
MTRGTSANAALITLAAGISPDQWATQANPAPEGGGR